MEPGSVGENLTTTGVEWSTLPTGTRARIGSELLIELLAPAMPCDTQRHNFLRGQISRISSVLHPADSRMYARVLHEGEVRPGDPIEVLAAGPGLGYGGAAAPFPGGVGRTPLGRWNVARSPGRRRRDPGRGRRRAGDGRTAGHLGRLLQPRGRPADAAAPAAARAGPLPCGRRGRLVREPRHALAGRRPRPQPGRLRGRTAGRCRRSRRRRASASGPWGRTMREAWLAVVRPIAKEISFRMDTWGAAAPHLLAESDVHVYVAEQDGKPVACGALYIHRKVGLLRTGRRATGGTRARSPACPDRRSCAARGGARLRPADLAGSARSGVRPATWSGWGFRRVAMRGLYRFDPAADPVPELTERRS